MRFFLVFFVAFFLASRFSADDPELRDLETRLEETQARREKALGKIAQELQRAEGQMSFLEGYAAGQSQDPNLARKRVQAAAQLENLGAEPELKKRRGQFGGILRHALATDPPTLDPVRSEDTTSFGVLAQMIEGLVEFDESMQLRGVLAKSWKVSPDKRTYTFELKEGVRFHNGRILTAEDAVYSFARNLDPKALGVRVYFFDRIKGYPVFRDLSDAARFLEPRSEKGPDETLRQELIERLKAYDSEYFQERLVPNPSAMATLATKLSKALGIGTSPGPKERQELIAQVRGLSSWDFLKRGLRAEGSHRFVVELETPFAPFLLNLPMVNAGIVPREEVERLKDRFGFSPVGTGPFQFRDWEHDVSLELEAFPDYHGGRPYLDGMHYRIIPDGVTRLTEFEVGNLDLVHNLPPEKYGEIKETLEAGGSYPGVLVEKPMLHVFYFGMNPNREPFTDVRVRRAINHAVNKEIILKKVLKGRGVVAKGPMPPDFFAYDPDFQGYDYDPDKARALLKEAGYSEDNPLPEVQFWFNSGTSNDENAQIAEIFQAQMAEVGIEVELNSLAWGTYLDQVHRCLLPIFRLAWVASHANGDAILYALFHSDSIGQSNSTCTSIPELDDILDEARATHDDAKRIALYRRAQEILVDAAVWVPLFHNKDSQLRKPWVRDVSLNARGVNSIRYRDAWIDAEVFARLGED